MLRILDLDTMRFMEVLMEFWVIVALFSFALDMNSEAGTFLPRFITLNPFLFNAFLTISLEF